MEDEIPETDRTPSRAPLRIFRASDGRFMASTGGEARAVRITTCFPWTAPDAYISLRDADDREVALVASLDDVDAESRAVLVQALREAAFAFEITQVAVIRKEFEIRHWEVTCREGLRTFQTHMDDWPRALPPHGLLITDVSGDVYVIHDWTALDRHSRKQLAIYID